MTGFPRYAMYFAAGADSALSRFGAGLLGYDAHTGDEVPFPDVALRVAPDWHDITADPRKYGFHATLKAPMATTTAIAITLTSNSGPVLRSQSHGTFLPSS